MRFIELQKKAHKLEMTRNFVFVFVYGQDGSVEKVCLSEIEGN
jgi:hypothetical protein